MTDVDDSTNDISEFNTGWMLNHQDLWADPDSRKDNIVVLIAALGEAFPHATRADIISALRMLVELRGQQLWWLH
jgi:hypothetical protein